MLAMRLAEKKDILVTVGIQPTFPATGYGYIESAKVLEGFPGARFNVMTSTCLTSKEAAEFDRLVVGKAGTRQAVKWAHDHGYGNAGATSGHLIPDYPRVLKHGWRGITQEIEQALEALPAREKQGRRAPQLRGMLIAAGTARAGRQIWNKSWSASR